MVQPILCEVGIVRRQGSGPATDRTLSGTHPIAQRYQSTSLLLSGLKRLEKLCQTPYEEGPKYDYPNKPRNHVPSGIFSIAFYGEYVPRICGVQSSIIHLSTFSAFQYQ